MECSRYFDCPTHVVERQLSDDEAEDGDAGEDEPTVHLQMEDDTTEISLRSRGSRTGTTNAFELSTFRVFPTSSTHRNTCATHWRVCPAGKVIEFGNLASCKRIVARLVSSSSLVIESTPYDAAPAAS
ncbi:FYVE zinc finger protein [Colletotrichum tabaci]|uniref:FYVE zinc finger protein n=1 Tax=Colletotrichum tabaci TaxID=1209068 RepID=A0AAV9TXA2_9PEZI